MCVLVLPRYRKICITIIVGLYHDILCITIYINEQLAGCSDISQTHRVTQQALKQTGEVHAYMVFSCYSGFSKRNISWSACQQRLGHYHNRKNTALYHDIVYISRYIVYRNYRGNTSVCILVVLLATPILLSFIYLQPGYVNKLSASCI